MPQTNNETTISTENCKNITKGEEHKKTWDALGKFLIIATYSIP